MADKSSWLRFLPPVLWEREEPAPAFSLGASLRIFEKILTGIDDGIVVAHDTHPHEAIQQVIARLHRLYDPWHTPPEYLRWLASWLALDFPEIWDEYQRRKVTSEIVGIYQQRGLKRGIEDFLDLYTVAATRPRITVDDSSKLLITKPVVNRIPDITSLNAQVPMVHPLAIARAPDGSLFMVDPGLPGLDEEEVWRIFPEGSYQVAGAPAVPTPLGQPAPGFNLDFPIAVAVDDQSPYHVYVVDRRSLPAPAAKVLWRLTAPSFAVAADIATYGEFAPGVFRPVAMAHDPANGHLLILGENPPRIYDVNVSVSPVTMVTTTLTQVTTPMSLAVLANGMLVIGDGRNQTTATPGDLVLVDRSTGPWTETLVLGGLPPSDNPLVAPTAIVEEAPGRLLVADVGLKPLKPDIANPFLKKIARHAAIYRVELVPASVELAAEPKQLVFPTGLVLTPDGTLFISDRGEAAAAAGGGPFDREWRALHQEFGVAVYFPDSPPTTPQQRRRLVHDVRQIINKEKPAHALWTFLFRV